MTNEKKIPEPKLNAVNAFSLDDFPEKMLGPTYRKRLEDAGIIDMYGLCAHGSMEVHVVTQMTLDDADKLVRYAKDHLIGSGKMASDFCTALDLYVRRQKLERISSGSDKFDKFLTGGFETQATTELFGEFSSGKTQICHTASVICQRPISDGGLEGQVIYVDTEGTFRPERIIDIAVARKFAKSRKDAEKYLENIEVAHAKTYSHQMWIVSEGIEDMIHKLSAENKKVKLVIVDSLMSLFRSEYVGQGWLARRQQAVNTMYHLLGRLAETYNFAVIVTNQMVASLNQFSPQAKAAGGNIVAHTSTYRISLRKNAKGIVARMEDSPMHESSEIVLELSEAGIVDKSAS